MKATITIEFEVDGECPPQESLEAAIWKLTSEAGYIGSEEIDGTDDWGLEIGTTTVSVDTSNKELSGREAVRSDDSLA